MFPNIIIRVLRLRWSWLAALPVLPIIPSWLS